MNPALVLVDMQKDYFPTGRMEVAGAVEASLRAKSVLDFFRSRSLPVVHIKHIAARPQATFLLPDTEGIEIHENVLPLPGESIVIKHYPNSFRGTQLEEYLAPRGIKELVVCGMMSHMCIDATVRAAFDKGYSCIVGHDACATRNLLFGGREIPAQHVHGAYMAALSAVYAKVSRADDIISSLKEIELDPWL